uniref:RH1 domain-containing protein n=1 Tax=Meloidogyne hapla TaxID=6305 RepID=A0A1I8BXP8_MELHA
MQKLLALLLGAAVQSPQRERFIERIKHMRPEIQSELVEEIQRVTNSANTNSPVVNLDSLLAELEQQPSTGEEAIDRAEEGIENNNQRVVALLERVIRERDEYTNELFEMAADMEQEGSSGSSSSGMATASSSCNGDISVPNNAKCISSGARSPSPNALDRHLSVELAAAKGELRKLRNENDEKDEILQEMQDELLQQRIEIGRLQAERLELVKDARAAKDYRDEMDCMQHKLNRLERLEAENEKLRSRLNELDFYKNRVNVSSKLSLP